MYQYLLGKVSTLVAGAVITTLIAYQYLLGKVSTNKKEIIVVGCDSINIY